MKMIKGHRIERKIEVSSFMEIISGFKEENINTTKHTFFRLSEKQRKIFKDEIIKDYIFSQTPFLVGLQYNGNYAVFYKYKKDILRLMLDIQPTEINIVTFYIVDESQIPRI